MRLEINTTRVKIKLRLNQRITFKIASEHSREEIFVKHFGGGTMEPARKSTELMRPGADWTGSCDRKNELIMIILVVSRK